MSRYSYLSSSLRAAAYRDLAGDARREAVKCKGSVREAYLHVALQWERLAEEAEEVEIVPARYAT